MEQDDRSRKPEPQQADVRLKEEDAPEDTMVQDREPVDETAEDVASEEEAYGDHWNGAYIAEDGEEDSEEDAPVVQDADIPAQDDDDSDESSGDMFDEHSGDDDDLPVIDDVRLKSIVESLIFVSGKIISLDRIMAVLGGDIPRKAVTQVLNELVEQYQQSNRGFVLMEVGGGYQFRSNPENADWIGRLFEVKPTRLSMAALEVLAIVAYRQPITRMELEELRGVDSSGVIKMLLQRKLIKILGYKEEPGRPRIYGTSAGFLDFFNLKSIRDLPPLRQYAELTDASRQRLETLISKGVKTKAAKQAPADSYAAGSIDPTEPTD